MCISVCLVVDIQNGEVLNNLNNFRVTKFPLKKKKTKFFDTAKKLIFKQKPVKFLSFQARRTSSEFILL